MKSRLLAAGAFGLLGCMLLVRKCTGDEISLELEMVSVDLPQTQVSPLPQQVEDLATSVAIFERRVKEWRERVDGCMMIWCVESN